MTEAQFKARYPQFATNANIAVYLSESLLFIGKAFEEMAELAQGLYVAHYCAVEAEERARAQGAPGAAWDGAVVSKSAGRLSSSRSAAAIEAQMKDPMLRTTYGQRFCAIRDQAGKGAIVAGARQFSDDGLGLQGPDDLSLPASEPGSGGEVV